MGRRRLSRELALRFLYQYDVLSETSPEGVDIERALRCYWRNVDVEVDDEVKDFATELARGTCENMDSIDAVIESFSEHWRVERMPKIDRNIIRMALYEMVYLGGIPPVVTINEAVDLAKKYGSTESGGFVNGVLDRVKDALQQGELKHDRRSDLEGG